MPWIHGSQEVHATLTFDEQQKLATVLRNMKREGRITTTVSYSDDEATLTKLAAEEYTEQDTFEKRYEE